jgi:hypothetical protein
MQVDLAAFVVTAGFLAAGVVLYLVARRGQGAEPL